MAVGRSHSDFAGEREQSPTSMLGTLLKQVVRRLEEAPRNIAQDYED